MPNTDSVPKTSSIANKIRTIDKVFHARSDFFLCAAVNNCTAISPAIIDRITAAICAMPYTQSYDVKI